jgi:hypothetical protein
MWVCLDRREDNGEAKLDERYLAILQEVFGGRLKPMVGLAPPGRGKCW